MMKAVSNPFKDVGARRVITYARVSSKEQEKEGFSIPAQQKLLQGYASANNFTIAREYVDIETAKQSGRKNFEELVRFLHTHPAVQTVLVEKTDRLYRNLKDWVTLDELDIEIHLVKEGIVLSRDSKSSEKFVHGIKVLMAKNYIDNLSEEARKGQLEKAAQGIWPTKAPLGYRNIVGPDGKKIIQSVPEVASVINQLFGWYATGTLALKDAAKKAFDAGLVSRRTGGPLPVSNIHAILRNLLYTGDFLWKGQRYVGKHQPIVSRELWQRVQEVLDDRNARKIRSTKRDFAFSGLMNCGHCGCALVGELKKGRYVYYHCTGYKGKCPEPYIREEVISKTFADLLGKLSFSEGDLAWVRKALLESHADEQKEHVEAVQRLQTEHERLRQRMHAMYVDKLDGRIDQAFYEQMSGQWRAEQEEIATQIARHQVADHSYLKEGVRLIELAHGASRAFMRQDPSEQRRLLNFVLSNSVWKDGALAASFRQPFDLIAEFASAATGKITGGRPNPAEHTVWLGN